MPEGLDVRVDDAAQDLADAARRAQSLVKHAETPVHLVVGGIPRVEGPATCFAKQVKDVVTASASVDDLVSTVEDDDAEVDVRDREVLETVQSVEIAVRPFARPVVGLYVAELGADVPRKEVDESAHLLETEPRLLAGPVIGLYVTEHRVGGTC